MNIEVPYLVPTTVDSSNDPHQLLADPLWNNLLLLLGFGLQHRSVNVYFIWLTPQTLIHWPFIDQASHKIKPAHVHPCSGMPRGPLKYLASLVFSESNHRMLFVGVTSAYLGCVFYFWAPMTYSLWDVEQLYLQIIIYGKLYYVSLSSSTLLSLLVCCVVQGYSFWLD